jgi:hypothetical protein
VHYPSEIRLLQNDLDEKKKMGEASNLCREVVMLKLCFVGLSVASFVGCPSSSSTLSRQEQSGNASNTPTQTTPQFAPNLVPAPTADAPDRSLDAATAPIRQDESFGEVSHEVPKPPVPTSPTLLTIDTVMASLKERAANATAIVIGKITAKEVFPKVWGGTDISEVRTVMQLDQIEIIRGGQAPKSIELRGGQIGDMNFFAGHQPQLQLDTTYLILFQGTQAYEAWVVDDANSLHSDGFVIPNETLLEALK